MTTTTRTRPVTGTVEIVERSDQHRFELHVDGVVRGLVVYCDDGPVRALVHTEVDAALQGRGLAGRLVEEVLDDIARTGRRVVPACGFVAHFIDEHPRYRTLVAD